MIKIKFEFSKEIIDGLIIKEDDNYYTIKLKSGYNSIFEKSNIKILEKEEIKLKDKEPLLEKPNKDLPKIYIIHTGGTIASKVDYQTGAVSSKFTPEEILALYPELKNKVNISIAMIGNLFSEDMRFAHYNLMLKQIEIALKENPIGIIISHGTDTMHYTSAALQYSCENLPCPVLLVGAQRSSDRPSSDAYSNLNAAVEFFIENSKLEKGFNRVGALMHTSISDDSFTVFDSINLKKMHSTRRDAFKQINYLPFAKIDDGIAILRPELLSKRSKGEFSYTLYDEDLRIGFLKSHPNIFPEEISKCDIYDALIIEGTGLGHIAINEVDDKTKVHKENYLELKKLSKKLPVIMGLQTVFGQTNMNVYSSGRYIQDAGVLGNLLNLTTETLFIKTAFCLSKDKKNFNKLFLQNLEGFEIESIYI